MEVVTRKLPASIGGLKTAIGIRFSPDKPWSVHLSVTPDAQVWVSREALWRGIQEPWGNRHVRTTLTDDGSVRIQIEVIKNQKQTVTTVMVQRKVLVAAFADMERIVPYGYETFDWAAAMQDLTETYAAYLSREFPS